jgi:hypothetical protein
MVMLPRPKALRLAHGEQARVQFSSDDGSRDCASTLTAS